jgi:hypothetical protein
MSIVIHEDKQAYGQAVERATSKKKIFSELVAEVKKFVSLDEKSKPEMKVFKTNPKEWFKAAFLKKYESRNQLSLSFRKLTEALELNTTNVDILSDQFINYSKDNDDPQQSDFLRIANTQDEIDRYEDAKKICELIMNTKATLKPNLDLMQIATLFRPMIRFDIHANVVFVNPDWVLDPGRTIM